MKSKWKLLFRVSLLGRENHMENQMEHDMETAM